MLKSLSMHSHACRKDTGSLWYRLGYDTVYLVMVTKVIVSDHALLEFFMWVGGIFVVMCRS